MTVDLRSDTVTKPTPEMLEAMVTAELGDDVLGHDPTTERLEALAAETVGTEAALFVPSGTMGNQIALATHTRPGDSVLFEDDAHMLFYEGAAPAVFAGVQARTVPSERGIVDPERLSARILKRSEHTPGSTLLCLENTHNRAGGTVTPVETHARLRRVASEHGLKVHLDGARVFNAAVALRVPVREIARHVDTLNFCLSKGLSAPVGSILCGPTEFIREARYWRKRMGGGMRQSGVLAACGIVSLTHLVDRLAEDHRRAQELAASAADLPCVRPVPPETNILMLDLDRPAAEWQAALEARGVLSIPVAPHRLRLVFHKDVDDEGLEHAAQALRGVAETGCA